MMPTLSKSALMLLSTIHVALAQPPLGQFKLDADIGPVKHAGSVRFDPVLQTYTMKASGTNMWFDQDECHFTWRMMRGDFVLRTEVRFLSPGVEPHRKLGWMVRPSRAGNAPYVDVAVHGDGLTSLQFRRTQGANTEQIESTVKGADVVQLARKGKTYTMSVAHRGEALVPAESLELDLGEEVMVGLFLCAHNADVVEEALFRNTRIIVPAPDDFVPYRDYIGSNLEILDLESGNRTIIHRAQDSFQAPNWTRDNRHLIYNHNGKLFRYALATGDVSELNTDFATHNNNDHVLSFDGTMLGISHQPPENGGRSIVYTLPSDGGTPKQITPTGPSYLHGWSPDKQYLVFTGGRNDIYNIYKIPAAGGDEIQLTHLDTLDDGPEYTPDGGAIYFNSTRTGTMQIWRMKPDGSEQTQVTNDEYNNWFPHVSPDGQSIVLISYSLDVAPDDHPFYKHCVLRRMPITGGKPTIIAYVFGGQCTINVPSWSPDGKKIAFVSNTRQFDLAGQ